MIVVPGLKSKPRVIVVTLPISEALLEIRDDEAMFIEIGRAVIEAAAELQKAEGGE